MALAGLADLVTSTTTKGTRTSFYKKPHKYADYLLVNKHAEVEGFQVMFDPEVSDHCPLVLEM